MKVLASWLQELLDGPAAPEAIAAAFDDLGTPVEEEVRLGEGLDGIVVAQVLALRSHPNADKIQLVDVDRGDGESLQICCGAFNMAVGDRVPLATLGTVMPGSGMEIERRKLRGEWSNGMLCSARELELGDDHGGILVLADPPANGTPIADALGIEPDVRWDLEINPNRPDAMSVAGLARDIAPRLGVGFVPPAPPPVVERSGRRFGWADGGDGGLVRAATSADGPSGDAPAASPRGDFGVDVAAADGCGRFVAAVLRGVDPTAPSPPWLRRRLTELGMRPISGLVDVSNYVMLELGQPNHPYDLARVAGATLRVRRARQGETLVTLDDVERSFTTDDLLICDGDDRAVGLAGIMGGAACEISDSTTDVLVELAWFDPTSISRTSRRLGLRSEASARFEKGADPGVLDLALDRFAELATEVCGARTEPAVVDVRGHLPDRPPVRLRTARVNALLGTELGPDRIRRHLASIGFASSPAGEGDVDQEVTIPTWRYDCAVEIDLVEEVGRHEGYRNLPDRELTAARSGRLTERQLTRRGVRRLMTGLGLAECLPLPFLAPGQLERAGLEPSGIELVNPMVAEESILRTSLLPGMVAAASANAVRRQLGVGLWEIGHVFRRVDDVDDGRDPVSGRTDIGRLCDEREHLAVLLAGRDAPAAVEVWQILAEQLRLPDPAVVGAVLPGLHPTRGALTTVAGSAVGSVGEIDPEVLARHDVTERVAWLEVDLGALLDGPRRDVAYRQVSRFPSSDVDLAFEVSDDVSAIDVERTIADAHELVWSVRLFDVYRGAPVADGRRSLAYAVRLQSVDHTLTDAEVADVRTALIAAVESSHAGTLRT